MHLWQWFTWKVAVMIGTNSRAFGRSAMSSWQAWAGALTQGTMVLEPLTLKFRIPVEPGDGQQMIACVGLVLSKV